MPCWLLFIFKYHTWVRSVGFFCPLKAFMVTCGIMKASLQGRNFQIRSSSGPFLGLVSEVHLVFSNMNLLYTFGVQPRMKKKKTHFVNVIHFFHFRSLLDNPDQQFKRSLLCYLYLFFCLVLLLLLLLF